MHAGANQLMKGRSAQHSAQGVSMRGQQIMKMNKVSFGRTAHARSAAVARASRLPGSNGPPPPPIRVLGVMGELRLGACARLRELMSGAETVGWRRSPWGWTTAVVALPSCCCWEGRKSAVRSCARTQDCAEACRQQMMPRESVSGRNLPWRP